MDIVSGVSLSLERGKDRRNAAASAQSDIAKFYDSISPMLISQWMLKHGYPPWLVASSVFFQLCVSVRVDQDGCSVAVGGRSTGTMTGTRVAGCFGECIVYDVIREAMRDAQIAGFEVCASQIVFASWVDNLFTVASSPAAAVANMRILEEKLNQRWNLKLKSGSQLFTSACGGKSCYAHVRGWKYVSNYPVLGCVVKCDGSCGPDVRMAEQSCWRRFWSGSGSKLGRRLPTDVRLRDVVRTVRPGLGFKCGWWQYNKTLGSRLDKLQRKIVSCIVRVPPLAHESPEEYNRRRMRVVARHCQSMKQWSCFVADRIVSWYGHCKRAHLQSWATELLAASHREFLISRRIECGSRSAYGGRTDTRSERGPPMTRFEDGVEEAREATAIF